MEEPMRIAALILAAGESSRFGSRKQEARIGGTTLLGAVIELAREAELHPVFAVVPPGLAVPADVVPVINDAPSDGISRSLTLGIAALPGDIEAAVILLGDQPTLPPASIRAVIDASGQRAVVAVRGGSIVAPPVLLKREAFGLVDEARGDLGLAPVLAAHPDLVAFVEVGEHAPDIDTPEDLEAVARARIAHMFDSSAER
jgi:molybdenum cofactor cytidylyltransferase